MTKPAIKYKKVAKPKVDIVSSMQDPNLFKGWFPDYESWKNWSAFLATVFGIKMDAEQQEVFRKFTGRTTPPNKQYNEAWLCVGRRGGKSLILALIAIYLGCFMNWRPYLSPGERATIMIIAADRRQARVIFRYIEAFLKQVPMLKTLIERETAEIFELSNQVSIEIHTASFRAIRGYTIVAALLDEVAFWRSEDSTNPDYEILNALRPGMATIPDGIILAASSPYARKGVLWDNWKRYYGQDNNEILVWQAATWDMNPTIPDEFFREKFEQDAASANAEYGGQFRTDVETFVTQEVINACTDDGIYDRPYNSEYDYVAFTDPSGGSKDSFTLAIAHKQEQGVFLDLVVERKPPFSPDEVVSDFCKIIRSYGTSLVTGDRYGGEWPRERFLAYDVVYQVSGKTKSDIYGEMLPLLHTREAHLLDNKTLATQLVNLERRTSRGGKDSIDHPPGGHDDVINSVSGALTLVKGSEPFEMW